ncbi:hypothetical protein HZH68_008391 [Vespula germanica]|uniref:Uncharacterized protein n=1 Tax=Vespula germanica TaxID=30212 RepID=A0A834N9G2_VESGE|nr:hypothetical protein HZH68_008391 [Vespula germanica]
MIHEEEEDEENVEKEKEEENLVSSRNSTLKDQSRLWALERAFQEILQATETDSRKKRNGRKPKTLSKVESAYEVGIFSATRIKHSCDHFAPLSRPPKEKTIERERWVEFILNAIPGLLVPTRFNNVKIASAIREHWRMTKGFRLSAPSWTISRTIWSIRTTRWQARQKNASKRIDESKKEKEESRHFVRKQEGQRKGTSSFLVQVRRKRKRRRKRRRRRKKTEDKKTRARSIRGLVAWPV